MVDNALKALQLATPQTSVSVASPDGINGRGRYSSLVSSGIEMGILNCAKKNPGDDVEVMLNHENEQPRRYAPRRRSAHFSMNLGPIRAHPELPEGDSDPEDGRKECNEGHTLFDDKN